MSSTENVPLSLLYERDETAWLDIMSQLAAEGRCAEVDRAHLSEYLADMARRDRREVKSRRVTLLAHMLTWEHQPQLRSGSWRSTIIEQRDELNDDLESGTLRNHALEVLESANARACKKAAAETGMPSATFPAACPWDLDTVLADDDAAE